MSNNINVNVNPMGGLSPIYMEFLNGGKITVPASYGGYVIASGCGAGKTTIIKQLIANPAVRREGVLYSAFTIKECDDMYSYVKSIYEAEGRLDKLNDEVIVLHSNFKSEGTNNNLWRHDPNKLLTMPIIICTHAKLLNELPEVLIRYKGFPRMYNSMSPVERAMAEIWVEGDGTKICYMPRQLILIDELPLNEGFNIQVPKSVIRALGYKRCYPEPNGARMPDGNPVMIPYMPAIYDRPYGFNQMTQGYEYLTRDQKFMEVKDELGSVKLELILGSIYDNYHQFVEYKEDVVSINYNASSLLMCNPATRILLFEGTGDLTFVNSMRFKLLTYSNKYNSKVNIYKFRHNLKRYHKPNSDFNFIRAELESNADMLADLIRSGRNPLIVTWKNLKSDEYKDKKSYGDTVISNQFLNDDFSLPAYYRDALSRRGIIAGYDIIHYQSGLDKATNEFRDYDSVVFLGEFHVPNYAINKFNLDYGTGTSVDNFTTYQLVQAICRTRIRKHRGEEIYVYFSDDWNDKIQLDVINYISSDTVKVKDSTLDWIKPKWRTAIKSLMNFDPDFNEAIMLKITGLKFYIDLDEIYRLIPMSEKKVRAYYSLISYLRKYLGIELVIKSNDTKFSTNYNPKCNKN